MNKQEFTYNYYFELYKEKSVLCHRKFKNIFKKENPSVKIDIDKLVVEIEKYQIKRYGHIKYNDSFVYFVDVEDAMRNACCRKYRKFGNKTERERRNAKRKRDEGK